MIIEEQARPFDHHAQTFAGLESIMAPNLRYGLIPKDIFLINHSEQSAYCFHVREEAEKR